LLLDTELLDPILVEEEAAVEHAQEFLQRDFASFIATDHVLQRFVAGVEQQNSIVVD
jgi:hypothetical protein